jgi:hypothetical protein
VRGVDGDHTDAVDATNIVTEEDSSLEGTDPGVT